ncbi:MAG: hypothetical protein KAG92_08500, partial [Deltaproteobacteria bacterium]|nr:hypothetical protein [Deltaproteobacteria bacterium]
MRQRQLLMTGFVQEVFYRPILLLLSVVIWAIFASVCCGLTPFAVLSSAFLLIFFYYLLLRRYEIRPGVYLFLL